MGHPRDTASPTMSLSDGPAALVPAQPWPIRELRAGTVRLSSGECGSLRTPVLTARPEGTRRDLCATLA